MCSQHSHKLVHLCSKAPSLPLPKKFCQCLVFCITKKVLHPWRSADIRFIEECNPHRTQHPLKQPQYMGGSLEISTWHPKRLQLQFAFGTFAGWQYQTGWWSVAQSFLRHVQIQGKLSWPGKSQVIQTGFPVFLPSCFGKEIISLPFWLLPLEITALLLLKPCNLEEKNDPCLDSMATEAPGGPPAS